MMFNRDIFWIVETWIKSDLIGWNATSYSYRIELLAVWCWDIRAYLEGRHWIKDYKQSYLTYSEYRLFPLFAQLWLKTSWRETTASSVEATFRATSDLLYNISQHCHATSTLPFGWTKGIFRLADSCKLWRTAFNQCEDLSSHV